MLSVNKIFTILKRNWLVLIVVPLVIAVAIFSAVRLLPNNYPSSALVYTGFTSGFDIETLSQGKEYQQIAANFDNVINIANSRETHTNVAIHLLAESLVTPRRLNEDARVMLNDLVSDSLKRQIQARVDQIDPKDQLPIVVKFLQEQIKLNHPELLKIVFDSKTPWSVSHISAVTLKRVGFSDMISLRYETLDPFLAQRTLQLLIAEAAEKNNSMKRAEAERAVDYYTKKLTDAEMELKLAEQQLSEFKKGNNIVNYEEQSKFMAVNRDVIRSQIAEQRTRLQGAKNALRELDSKLQMQNKNYEFNYDLNEKRKEINTLSDQLTKAQINRQNTQAQQIQQKIDQLKEEISTNVNKIYQNRQQVGGASSEQLFEQWLENTVIVSDAEAKIAVYENELSRAQGESSTFAPVGSVLDQLNRTVSLKDLEYRTVVENLNSAKLRLQNISLNEGISIVDQPTRAYEPSSSKKLAFLMLGTILAFGATAVLLIAINLLTAKPVSIQDAENILGMSALGKISNLRKIDGKVDKQYKEVYGNLLIDKREFNFNNVTLLGLNNQSNVDKLFHNQFKAWMDANPNVKSFPISYGGSLRNMILDPNDLKGEYVILVVDAKNSLSDKDIKKAQYIKGQKPTRIVLTNL